MPDPTDPAHGTDGPGPTGPTDLTGLAGRTALVVGAGRGLGRGVARALAGAGATVVAVARTEDQLRTLAEEVPGLQVEVADAAGEGVAATLLTRHRPGLLVLVAGRSPSLGPLHRLSWEEFSAPWHADVRIAFSWLGEALRLPLEPGSTVVLFSSGAALQGSPISGGYAGAKATQRFLARYAQDESDRAGLGLRLVTLLPRLTPATDLGRPAVAGYAAREGLSVPEYLARLGDPLTPEIAGSAVVGLAGDRSAEASGTGAEYLLTGQGLHPLT